MDQQKNKAAVPEKRFFDRQFFLIGARLAVVVAVAFLWKVQSGVAENAAARRGATTVLRATNPDLAWAFAEWSECDEGAGQFAGKGILTREACNRAVASHAKNQETAARVATVFRLRDAAALEDIEVIHK